MNSKALVALIGFGMFSQAIVSAVQQYIAGGNYMREVVNATIIGAVVILIHCIYYIYRNKEVIEQSQAESEPRKCQVPLFPEFRKILKKSEF